MQDWTGTIYLGAEWALFVGQGGATPLHRHLAHKLVMGLDGELEVNWASGERRHGRIALVKAGSLHRVTAPGRRIGLYYADAGAFAHSGLPASRQLRELFRLCRRLDLGAGEAPTVVQQLQPDMQEAADARVLKAVDALRRDQDLALPMMAPRAGVSPRRLRQLFSASVGGTPVRYRRWWRLRLAAQQLAQGERIVDAALAAGFADAAHLTRTFVEMLGITPGVFQASRLIVLDELA
ncbi:Methylphosphotriester-DNA--protein-cysteine methyltransferase (N-terminal fragment of Ada), contains Zn-binding and two AraC-type DNA-binding domains [Solimonas aquatica]|uniref:Methylphosphotriester-DNA--protein-cysteine methyltransferase (N-terminal of Ada), contains Zn-binding and two AraC-type DNA-binding domains n=1 Tax=Solimonas aquatica TaxID=489703 RepID=A0A1H9CGH2_9GAMM|nr:helix-turn-helix domain-containing protein [Solimonas aquatica]SEQ00326.1 Methylphosphotriester-DNA--protein-cysteine methyltransferase (N-terminal fragment of Ada), contains Zn-binding and two AraC-type DNA-binding domains [Solimonas aquatica]